MSAIIGLLKRGRGESGFTLIEMIVAITIIGIAMPGLFVYFSGLKDSSKPENIIKTSFMAQRQMEAMASVTISAFPNTSQIGITCAAFQGYAPAITCSATGFTFTFDVENVDADDPDTLVGGANKFFRKVTMYITGPGGDSFQYSTIF